MKTIDRRLRRVEHQFGLVNGEPQRLIVVVSKAGTPQAFQDRCMQILEECGFLPAIGVVNIGAIPGGLSAEELERFLREDGAQICSPQPSTDGCLGQR
jgi:hypothetical protein